MRRVYKKAAARPAEGGWGVALDGRPMRTPARHELVVPSTALAEAIAEEWDAQQDEVRPATMPLTRLAATAIDRTGAQRDLIVAEAAKYAGTDLVCYRAEHPPALIARQHAEWQPLIDWAMQRYDAALAVTSGVVPRPQSPATLNAFAAAVAAQDNFMLTALHTMTAACGSLVIALALLEGRLDAEAAFAVSQLDETFQIEAWGEDAEAAARRRALADDVAAASRFVHLLGEASTKGSDVRRAVTSGAAALTMFVLPLIVADAQQPAPPECAQNAPVCGLKDGSRQTYWNACLAARDGAQLLYAGGCRISRSYG
ncbi:MAG: ATPase [Alphaproteobacteria bacterium]|nr:ATPase [Alphaproteobacteria bacterium]